MFKKMMLLALAAAALVAFAVPASASAANEWIGNHEDTLTGKLSFGNPAAGQTKFGCETNTTLDVFGGTSTGEVTAFTPTTATCSGEGAFAGCTLTKDETTLPTVLGTSQVKVHITAATTMKLTTPPGNPIVLHNTYGGGCLIESSTLTVSELHLKAAADNLTDVTVSGVAVSHVTIGGVVQPPTNVAVFGTLHTKTDTITFN